MNNAMLLVVSLTITALATFAYAQACDVELVAGGNGLGDPNAIVNGPPLLSTFSGPTQVAKLPDGSFLVADGPSSCVRKYVPGGQVSTFSGKCGELGLQFGSTGAEMRFYFPWGLHVSATGRIFLSDHASRVVWLMNANGGAVLFCYGFSGSNIQGMAEDPATQELYVAEGYSGGSDAIQVCPAQGGYPTLWKSMPHANPHGLHIDQSGAIYVAAFGHHQILAIDRTTKASSAFCGTGAPGNTNGACTAAQLNNPMDITSDSTGAIYVTDMSNHQVKAIVNGAVLLLAGTVQGNAVGGCTNAAQFRAPVGIAAIEAGKLLVSDFNNGALKSIEFEALPTVSPPTPDPPTPLPPTPAPPTHDPAASAVCDDVAAQCVQLAAECVTIRNGGYGNVADDCDTTAALCTDVENDCRGKVATCPLG